MLRKILILVLLSSCSPKAKNIIFFHPDGMGLNTWNAVRLAKVGPDGRLNYDKMNDMAIYLGHMKNSVTSTSNGGATSHAYGQKVHFDSYGLDKDKLIVKPDGSVKLSIVKKALKKGKRIGIVNSGTITEPGTGAFIALVNDRDNHDEIVRQIMESNIDVIFGGGEEFFLPTNVRGKYAKGSRKDGLNLIEIAKDKGYKVIYTREELLNLPKDTKKVLGLFAKYHTFNDKSEEILKKKNLPLFNENSPTISEMTQVAMEILANGKEGFLLISEEEATDNFGNHKNAMGVIEAGIRADDTIGKIMTFIDKNPNTTLITTSDSDAGGMQSIAYRENPRALSYFKKFQPEYDGINGSKKPFISKADKFGKKHKFYILWAGKFDVSGGILVKSYGKNSGLVKGVYDNTDIYNFIDKNL